MYPLSLPLLSQSREPCLIKSRNRSHSELSDPLYADRCSCYGTTTAPPCVVYYEQP